MHTEQPLTSAAAFALALVEASSRLTGVPDSDDTAEPGLHPDDELVAAAD